MHAPASVHHVRFALFVFVFLFRFRSIRKSREDKTQHILSIHTLVHQGSYDFRRVSNKYESRRRRRTDVVNRCVPDALIEGLDGLAEEVVSLVTVGSRSVRDIVENPREKPAV